METDAPWPLRQSAAMRILHHMAIFWCLCDVVCKCCVVGPSGMCHRLCVSVRQLRSCGTGIAWCGRLI